MFRELKVFSTKIHRGLRGPGQAWLLLSVLLLAIVGSGHVAAQGAASAPRIVINGADEELQANILGSLRVASEPCTTSLLRLQRLLPQVRRNASDAAKALGYYHSTSDATFSGVEGCWQLVLEISPGPRVLLDTVNLQVLGTPQVQAEFSDLLRDSVLRSGAPLHHGHYEELKSALSARAADRGFFSARFAQAEIALDTGSNLAQITLSFDPGEQFRFGVVSIVQDGDLSEELVRGLMPLREGDAYSSAALAELRRKLDASQYFRQIRVTPQLGAAASQTVPVLVELGLRPRHAWTGGLGFTTDTGPRARLSYDNRYLNTRGHKLALDSAFSSVRSEVDGNYVIPLADAARQSLNFGGGYSVENNDTFQSKRAKVETSLRNENSAGWLQSVFVEVQRDDYVIDVQEDTSVLTMLGASLGKTEADNLINPSAGWKVFTQIRGASDSVFSDTTFVQLYGSARHVYGFGRSRLLSRLELGATWIDAARELPASLRYFAGGDQSIRGYDFRSLGPLNENNEVIGGKQLVVGSLELDFQVRDKWRVAVFADSGNAFNASGNLKLRHSAGFGLRWLSPIGPVRIDLAHPIDGDESFRLHITMGPDL